jgi:hypothetical protein
MTPVGVRRYFLSFFGFFVSLRVFLPFAIFVLPICMVARIP